MTFVFPWHVVANIYKDNNSFFAPQNSDLWLGVFLARIPTGICFQETKLQAGFCIFYFKKNERCKIRGKSKILIVRN